MLGTLEAALDELVEADPATLADGEAIEALHHQLARLEAVTTRAAAAFDAGQQWQAGGARTAAAWISLRCSLPKAVAHRRVRLGRALGQLPAAEAAWLDGAIGSDHVSALAGARTPSTAEAMDRDQAMLVGQARTLRYDQFRRVLAYWYGHADPDGTERSAQELRDGRRLHLSRSFEGTWVLDGLLDPISGAIVARRLGRIEDELFEADWAEARGRLGERASAEDLRRSPAQRRVDALVEMATRAGTAPIGGRRPEPLFSVFVGYETLAGRICELADSTPVSPGSLVPWLEVAWLERVVFDTPSRVIDVGVTRRLFEGATRSAVQYRDRECQNLFCDLPAERCQIDHHRPWALGGLTTVDNGRVACGFHNRARARAQRPPPESPPAQQPSPASPPEPARPPPSPTAPPPPPEQPFPPESAQPP